jgi:hypothetical protein
MMEILWGLVGIVGAAGLVVAARDRKTPSAAPFCVGLLAFSLAATAAGFYWRQHYFILTLPAVAILMGAAVSAGRRMLAEVRLPKAVQLSAIGVFVAALAYAGVQQREILLEKPPAEACRMLYGLNPFPEAVEIAGYLRENTSPDDRLAVLGSEPEIYFYAHRLSATGYVYVYPLMEPQRYAREMQDGMIEEIKKAQPKYIVMVSPTFRPPYELRTSWLWYPDSEKALFAWMDDWVRTNYEVVGLDIPDRKATSIWGPAAAVQVQRAEKQRTEALLKSQPPGTPPPRLSWILLDVPVIAVLRANRPSP